MIAKRTIGMLLLTGVAGTSYSQSGRAQTSDLISSSFHLTARPWTSNGSSKSAVLSNIKGLVGFFVSIQETAGDIPIAGTPAAQTTATFLYGAATLLASGDASYLSQTLRAMDWSTKNYAASGGNSADGPEFEAGPLAKSYALLAGSGQVPQAELTMWKSRMTAIKSTPNNSLHNWGAYAIDGAEQMAKAGLVSAGSAQAFIEQGWPAQAANFSALNDFYMDHSSSPDSMSVEGAGRGRIFDAVISGYNGPSAAAMLSVTGKGTANSLSLQGPSGDAPTGGRTSDHVWVDAGNMAAFETVAQNTSDPVLSGRYQRAADLAFNSVMRWKHADGSYSVTKNFYPDNGSAGPDTAALQNVGYQNASSYRSYNGNVLLGLAESYNAMSRVVAPVAAPAEIGGYSFATGPDWSTAFANAGGTQIEVETAGTATVANANFWSSIGIVRVGAMGFDSRLFGDGRFSGSDGVSFAPAWRNSNGAWQHMANKPTGYAGSASTGYTGVFTTTLATPVLTIDKITWGPLSGTAGPVFYQTLIITPDGVMSKVTQSGGYTWGMTLPLLATDGQTTTARSITGGIASTAAFGSTLSFLALDPTATLTAETQILSSYGQIMPVRAAGTASEQDVFVYPGQSGLSAAALKSSMTVTSGGYTSAAGSVSGTLYYGLTSAGGYGSAITLGSGESASFSQPCSFILQVHNGVITNVETDRAVTATIGGKSYSLGAFNADPVTAGGTAPPTLPVNALSISVPQGNVAGTAVIIKGTDNYSLGTQVVLMLDGVSSTVTPTISGNSFSVPTPAGVQSGTHTAQVVDGSKATSNTISFTVTAAATAPPVSVPGSGSLTGTLPSPLYIGSQLVTGTGGVAGLQIERITQGSYNTCGLSGWVKASVNANGTWSATVTNSKPNLKEHIFACQGGTTQVVDLVDGVPGAAP